MKKWRAAVTAALLSVSIFVPTVAHADRLSENCHGYTTAQEFCVDGALGPDAHGKSYGISYTRPDRITRYVRTCIVYIPNNSNIICSNLHEYVGGVKVQFTIVGLATGGFDYAPSDYKVVGDWTNTAGQNVAHVEVQLVQ